MKSKIIFALLIFAIIAVNAQKIYAQEKASASSAKILTAEKNTQVDYRVKILENFFKENDSPLALYASNFVQAADKYNLDWRLVPAISGTESTYGKQIPYNSYNAWGWGVYGTNVIRFKSWTDGIETVSQGLRERYMDQWGAKDIYEIGALYASSPHWASSTIYHINRIQDFALRNPKDSLLLSL